MSILRNRFPARLALSVVVVTTLCSGLPRSVDARPPSFRQNRQFPWQDPERSLTRLFGPEDEAEDELLSNIKVSASEERRIGKETVEQFAKFLQQAGHRVVQRGKDVDYLKDLVSRIHPMMKQRDRYPKINVRLVLSDEVDARSFPGGYLVFFKGLLEECENEAALIGMVGHELSHLDRGHHTRRIQRVKYAQEHFPNDLRNMQMESFFKTGSVYLRNWVRPFQPDLEREADLDGARWAYQANYDCRALGELFLQHSKKKGRHLDFMPNWFQSHPPGRERNKSILDEYKRLQTDDPKNTLHLGRENLRRRSAIPLEKTDK